VASSAASAGTIAYLVVRCDDGFGDVFPLTAGQSYTVGRASTNRIVLKDDLCSREHAEVCWAEARWFVRDLNSLNGTRINNEPLDSAWELSPRDVIHAGRTDLMFVASMHQLPEPRQPEDKADGSSRRFRSPFRGGTLSEWIEEVIESRIEDAALHKAPVAAALRRAQELVMTDPDMCLAKCRQILESTLSGLHRDTIGSPGTKRLEQLISDLARQGKLPRKVQALCEVVRELGNVGVHPIYDDELLSHREALISLQTLVIVLEWQGRANTSTTTQTPKTDFAKDGVPNSSLSPDSTPTVYAIPANATSAATLPSADVTNERIEK
jgi:hypothetical protein